MEVDWAIVSNHVSMYAYPLSSQRLSSDLV
jgi:hypothetical protein